MTTWRDEIAAHPWEAVAIAFAAGAYVAFDRSGSARRTILTSIGAAAIGMVREVVDRRFPPREGSWIDFRRRPQA